MIPARSTYYIRGFYHLHTTLRECIKEDKNDPEVAPKACYIAELIVTSNILMILIQNIRINIFVNSYAHQRPLLDLCQSTSL